MIKNQIGVWAFEYCNSMAIFTVSDCLADGGTLDVAKCSKQIGVPPEECFSVILL